MKRILLMMLAICTLASCSKDNGDDMPKNIEVTGGNTTQEVFADNTQGKEGVKFTTTGAWTSSIVATTKADTPDWVSIDPASGDKAGNYTINITLTPNYTGDNRKAEIKISCGGTTITITVEQKGLTESGNQPQPTAGYITTAGKITGGEIFAEHTPTSLRWAMRSTKGDVEILSPTSFPYINKNFDITLPTPTEDLWGELTDFSGLTITPSSAKFVSALLYDQNTELNLTNIKLADVNNKDYLIKKGEGYVMFVYASSAATASGMFNDDDDVSGTYKLNNCQFRQGWNEMVVIAESDATSNGSKIFNVTTNNASSAFNWVIENREPEQPQPKFDRVVSRIDVIDENPESPDGYAEFKYDDKQRISTLVRVNYYQNNYEGPEDYPTVFLKEKSTIKATYDGSKISFIEEKESDEIDPNPAERSTAQLDPQGRVEYVKELTSDEDEFFISYDANGFWSRTIRKSEKFDYEETYGGVWAGGNLHLIQSNGQSEETASYGTIPNDKTNIDLNFILYSEATERLSIAFGTYSQFYSMQGYGGNRSKNMVEKIHAIYGSNEQNYTFSYKLNGEGYPEKIRIHSLYGSRDQTRTYVITYTKL